MDTETEFKTVGELVRKLLSTDERCRNDDKLLTILVFQEISRRNGKEISFPIELLGQFPAFETVKRFRAWIQNKEKQYLPTNPIIASRRSRRQKDFGALFGSLHNNSGSKPGPLIYEGDFQKIDVKSLKT